MKADHEAMTKITAGLPTKAAKIRALDEKGFERADIARFLGIRYQHVRNTLERPKAKTPAAEGPVQTDGFAFNADANAFTSLTLGEDGRLTIPEELRALMKLGGDGKLIARIDEDGELRLTSPLTAIDKVRRLIAEKGFSGRSPVDELIEERRAEALREEAETLLHGVRS
ncbi:hypothetical protein [Jiella mangrovi]|uniref:SpoVT-AbrB domain-containing protein n=1 Tax=Jiella mangrovi TaxID=2821407 RepID=A0ABS4BGJ1_9HYPH|nr:hypothetical protein [Jiella mangrovi]MBP0615873.1 hypothetical protein [Jiella mangrovi]